ncbi:MAG: hypothetical protein A2583_06175 [Bdellovibrionales bacterium RIFOXYD1_FULL_53_11]|nr:MAG: hypothetical protein A2583_06175 [Bdellovibrionales bacterium RIFOXYD1_FULL_53_11]
MTGNNNRGVLFKEHSDYQFIDAKVNSNTLVIGGGIAGIQASLEVANAGYQVYLVEKSGTIGGHMAMFDKTFPTLDCAACILTPKMVEVGQNPNIKLMTLSEVKEVRGAPGNFKVKIEMKTRRVDIATCIGCGICTEKCPARAPSEFDAGISQRKAIYIPFPQAVPNKYLVDKDSCTYFKTGKCRVCEKVCPAGSVKLDDKDSEIEIEVGNIIVATGFKPFDPARAEQFGYGRYKNVLAPLQFERLINASGPTAGQIKMQTQDKKGKWVYSTDGNEPESVAIIHCVGSRDHNYNKHCSRVCCMYSLKFAHLIKEKLPNAEVFEYYIDMRAFGKGYEEFYQRIKEEGVHIIRGRTAKVEEAGNRLKIRSEDILAGKLIEQNVDMVILSAGLEPRENAKNIAGMLDVSSDETGWLTEVNDKSAPFVSNRPGIYLAGTCQGPKDIPDSVAQASAAAAVVLQSIGSGKIKKYVADTTATSL